AQESARLSPHVPSPMYVLFTGILRATCLLQCTLAVLWHVDSYPHVPKMVRTCRLQKAARFVFRGLAVDATAPMRAPRQAPKPAVIAMTNSATSHLLPVFARVDLGFERGEGAWLVATNGERYLDFTSGVAVNALGHAHPHLVAALQAQATKLWHMSNLFKSPDGERLAARLCEQSFADFAFFANSGAEAMECAIKMARKFQAASGRPERF